MHSYLFSPINAYLNISPINVQFINQIKYLVQLMHQ